MMRTGAATAAMPGKQRTWKKCPARLGLVALLVVGLAGCSLDDLVNANEIPPGLSDPAITKTPQGALATYRGTLGQFRTAFGGGLASGNRFPSSFVPATGLLSDELFFGDN